MLINGRVIANAPQLPFTDANFFYLHTGSSLALKILAVEEIDIKKYQ